MLLGYHKKTEISVHIKDSKGYKIAIDFPLAMHDPEQIRRPDGFVSSLWVAHNGQLSRYLDGEVSLVTAAGSP
jgi:hypothetical protein